MQRDAGSESVASLEPRLAEIGGRRRSMSTTDDQPIEVGDGAQAAGRLNVTWTTPLGEAVASIA